MLKIKGAKLLKGNELSIVLSKAWYYRTRFGDFETLTFMRRVGGRKVEVKKIPDVGWYVEIFGSFFSPYVQYTYLAPFFTDGGEPITVEDLCDIFRMSPVEERSESYG